MKSAAEQSAAFVSVAKDFLRGLLQFLRDFCGQKLLTAEDAKDAKKHFFRHAGFN